jgi:hypothetical protein
MGNAPDAAASLDAGIGRKQYSYSNADSKASKE